MSSRNRLRSRRVGGRAPFGSDAGSLVESPADDWLGEGLDWFEDTSDEEPEPEPFAAPATGGRDRRMPSRAEAESAAGSVPLDRRQAIVRRRQLAGLGALCLLVVLGVIIPLVVFDSGQGTLSPITTPPTVGTTATATTRPTTTTTSNSGTQTPSASRLRVVLPASGTLRRGDRGSTVVALQKALVAIGYDPGATDGVFGANTQAAVLDFQRSNNLQPDGVVGKETARTLNAGLSRRASAG